MTVFDLLFVILFLVSLGTLIAAAVSALRGRRGRAVVLLRRLGVVLALYFCAVILVSALSPQRFSAIGVDQCSDDWCIAVQSVRRDTASTGIRYEVTFRLASRARRVAQRERFVAVYLLDERGRRYAPATDASDTTQVPAPFDTLLQPEETVTTIRRFLVPTDAKSGGARRHARRRRMVPRLLHHRRSRQPVSPADDCETRLTPRLQLLALERPESRRHSHDDRGDGRRHRPA